MEDEEAIKTNNGNGKRGMDLPWIEYDRFDNKESYDLSDVCADIKSRFSKRKREETKHYDKEIFYCTYQRRKNFIP